MRPTLTTTEPFVTFANGRTLRQVLAAGQITDGLAKDGTPRSLTFSAGAVVLASASEDLLAGPLDVDGAEILAIAVIEGDSRVLTSPGIELRLASAVLALIGSSRREDCCDEASHGHS